MVTKLAGHTCAHVKVEAAGLQDQVVRRGHQSMHTVLTVPFINELLQHDAFCTASPSHYQVKDTTEQRSHHHTCAQLHLHQASRPMKPQWYPAIAGTSLDLQLKKPRFLRKIFPTRAKSRQP